MWLFARFALRELATAQSQGISISSPDTKHDPLTEDAAHYLRYQNKSLQRSAIESHRPRIAVGSRAPAAELLPTFMFGPIGLLLYFIVRVTMRHHLQIHVANANV
jgi:hypothetical protein